MNNITRLLVPGIATLALATALTACELPGDDLPQDEAEAYADDFELAELDGDSLVVDPGPMAERGDGSVECWCEVGNTVYFTYAYSSAVEAQDWCLAHYDYLHEKYGATSVFWDCNPVTPDFTVGN